MKAAIALLAVLCLAGSAYAGCPKEWADPRNVGPGNLASDFFKNWGAGLNPEGYRAQQHEEDARATYRALLQAGATEEIACAAALNPDFFRIVAPQYLRPQR
jgi:hypothetical protein